MKEVLVFTHDHTIIDFGVVPNFLVAGAVEAELGNMDGVYAMPFEMPNKANWKLIINEIFHADWSTS